MLDTLLAKVFGTENQRLLKRLQPRVAQINDREPEIRALSDDQLRARADGPVPSADRPGRNPRRPAC